MKVVLNYKFKSLNDYINSCRRNKYIGAKIKKDETEYCTQIFKQLKPLSEFPVHIECHWHSPSKIRDIDGFLIKNVLDGMVHAGFIPDDNVKYISKLTHEYHFSESDKLEIEIHCPKKYITKYCIRGLCKTCPIANTCGEYRE